ncbi:hypothetical protein LCGC14_2910820, partial [marine sediment metagenome]
MEGGVPSLPAAPPSLDLPPRDLPRYQTAWRLV